ncbi:MAG: GAP family protein [bacterium]|nr:GAP family protein [bacterium]
MDTGSCTAAGCFLARNGGLVSIPLVTIAGIVDGINPCAIGMIILLLGYLIVFVKKPEKILPYGGIYILTIYLTYLAIGLFFFKTAQVLSFTSWQQPFEKMMVALMLFAGLVNIKDFFFPHLPIHMEIPQRSRQHLFSLIEKMTIPSVILLGVLVTLLEAPCSIPIYAGTASILAGSGLPVMGILGYFLYYNFLFVLPLLVILFLAWKGKQMVELKEWEHKHKRNMKLSLGLLLVLMSGILLFF